MRAVLAGAPSLALRALAHNLILQTFFGSMGEGCVGIRASFVDLKPSADGIGESRAAVELAERHRTLLARLPKPERLWDWLDNQSNDVVLELVAYCVATTVNAVRRKGDGHHWARFDQADTLAKASGLDMAEWWEPHGDRYLNRVSKALILAAFTEAVSPQAADNIRALKRDVMAVRASELLAGKRWLPESLRPVSLPLAESA